MPYVLLTLAVIAGAAAIFLWYLDSKQRRDQQAQISPQPDAAADNAQAVDTADAADTVDTAGLEQTADAIGTGDEWSSQATYGSALHRGQLLDDEELATAEQLPRHEEPEFEGMTAVEPALDPEVHSELDSELKSELDSELNSAVDSEQDREAELEELAVAENSAADVSADTEHEDTEHADDGAGADVDADADADYDVEADAVTDAEQYAELASSEPVAKPAGPRRDSIIPGALRRERRQWAEKHGFGFSKHDDYLIDEWTRGAAAGGAAPKDIVQGSAFGHEMVLMDLGGVNVMAMRTGAATEIVVDFRRADRDQRNDRTTGEADFDDLLEVGHIADFVVYATDAAVASRMIDARVVTACDNIPEIVTAVWIESDWVLAQTDKGSHAADWDEMLAPLALLADVARVLPPRSMANQILKFEGADPTRMMGPKQPPAFENNQPLHVVPDPQDHPPVQRPSEPVELPTRSKADARGYLEPYALGADEVDAIADGTDNSTTRGRAKRPHMRRDLSSGPSIFGDD